MSNRQNERADRPAAIEPSGLALGGYRSATTKIEVASL